MTQRRRSQTLPNAMVHRTKSTCLTLLFALLTLAAELSANAGDHARIFAELTAEEQHKLEPTLKQTHFKHGLPRLYRRHRLLRIDTEAFQLQLMNDWKARKEGTPTDGVPVPLFEDQVIFVQVHSWIEGGFGVTSGYGRPRSDKTLRADFAAHFSEDGRLEASLNTESGSFLVTFVRDYEHYLVLEMEPFDGPID